MHRCWDIEPEDRPNLSELLRSLEDLSGKGRQDANEESGVQYREETVYENDILESKYSNQNMESHYDNEKTESHYDNERSELHYENEREPHYDNDIVEEPHYVQF